MEADHMIADDSADEILICYICGTTFDSVKLHNVHSCMAPDLQPITCFFCPKTFLSYRCWHLHEIYAHKDDILQIQQENSEEKKEMIFKDLRRKNHKAHKAKRKLQEGIDQIVPPEKQIKIEISSFSLQSPQNDELQELKHKASTRANLEKLVKCSFCDQHFYSESARNKHEVVHLGTENYSCSFCGISFFDSSAMKSHERSHTGEILYKCQHCYRTFDTDSQKVAHEQTHVIYKVFKCYYCTKSFKTNREKILCEQTHRYKKRIQCDVRDERLDTQALKRSRHVKIRGDINIYPCQYCDRRCRTRAGKMCHERIVHKIIESTSNKCQHCPKTFDSPTQTVTHEQVHVEKRFECDQCDQCNETNYDRQEHEQTQSDLRLFQCVFCGKHFKTLETKRKHEQRHINKKSFSCQVCDQRFCSRVAKVRHESVHIGGKPIKCQFSLRTYEYKKGKDKHEDAHL